MGKEYKKLCKLVKRLTQNKAILRPSMSAVVCELESILNKTRLRDQIPIASEAENLILEGNVKRRTNRSLRKDTWHLRHYRFDTQECELEYFNKNEKKEQKTKHKIDLKN